MVRLIKENNKWKLEEGKKENLVDSFILYIKKMLGINIKLEKSFKIRKKFGKIMFSIEKQDKHGEFSPMFQRIQSLSNKTKKFTIETGGASIFTILIDANLTDKDFMIK